MNITLSKREIIGGILIIVLLFAASLSFVAYRVAAQDSGDAPSVSTEEKQRANLVQNDLENLQEALADGSPNPDDIPHASCRLNVLMRQPSSTTYVAPQDFNTTFLSTAAPNAPHIALQDINGDNLPDYVYTYNSDNFGSSDVGSSFVGCVYLNNGHTWEKVWQCYANTVVALSTGEVIHRDYRGDCAG